MALYILVLCCFILTILNYCVGKKDLMNPSVIFCVMNLIYSIVCLVIKYEYKKINFHYNTAFVFISGMIIFTFFNIISQLSPHIKIKHENDIFIRLQIIKINKVLVFLLILFSLIVAYFMFDYAKNISKTFYPSSTGFTNYLSNMNNIKKKYGKELNETGIHSSPVYVLGWPFLLAANIFISFILINNYMITKKITWCLLLFIVITFLMTFLSGSRSTSFRLITAYFFQFITIYRLKNKSNRKGQIKLFAKLLVLMSIALLIIAYSINFIGRSTKIPIFEYFTAYVGAPFFNLDHAINNGIHQSKVFGQETFQHFYSILSRLTGNKQWKTVLNLPYHSFFDGRKWRYLGNVYTMYYMYIEDFGYLGVLFLTPIVAFYYSFTYRMIQYSKNHRTSFGVNFFIYCYFFNDLFMLTFSNRFFEAVFDLYGLQFIFWIIIINIFFKAFYKNRIIIR